jgi:hypothetical protein
MASNPIGETTPLENRKLYRQWMGSPHHFLCVGSRFIPLQRSLFSSIKWLTLRRCTYTKKSVYPSRYGARLAGAYFLYHRSLILPWLTTMDWSTSFSYFRWSTWRLMNHDNMWRERPPYLPAPYVWSPDGNNPLCQPHLHTALVSMASSSASVYTILYHSI